MYLKLKKKSIPFFNRVFIERSHCKSLPEQSSAWRYGISICFEENYYYLKIILRIIFFIFIRVAKFSSRNLFIYNKEFIYQRNFLIKNVNRRSSLSDASLSSLMRTSSSKISINIPSLVETLKHCKQFRTLNWYTNWLFYFFWFLVRFCIIFYDIAFYFSASFQYIWLSSSFLVE